MNLSIKAFIIFILSFPQISNLHAQKENPEIAQIRTQRNASNAAIRQYNDELSNSFLTDDTFITTGAGTLISGKDELTYYLKNAKGAKMYWVRTPIDIRVNQETMLAWESGTWEGFYEDSKEPVVGGNYSAMWTKASGAWLLKSQLFVTLVD